MKRAVLLIPCCFALCCFGHLARGQSFSRSYAIVVGISQYAQNNSLPNAQPDAEAMAAFLKSQQYQVSELYNQNATRAAILDAMDDMARKATSRDRVLFFFAGHGFTETSGDLDWGYIVPYDGRPRQPSSMIGMEQLRSESERMGNAHHQLFLIDSCYGGTIGMRDSLVGGVDPRIPNYIDEITRRVAREALTAGGKDQRVEDGARNGHSRFTVALLEALQEGLADLDGDGYVTFPELQAYVLSKAASSLQTPATAYLPGHGMGEYWFEVPGHTARALARAAAPEGTRRDIADSSDQTAQAKTGTPNAAASVTHGATDKPAVIPPDSGGLTLSGPPGFRPLPVGSGRKIVLSIGNSELVVGIGGSSLGIYYENQQIATLPCGSFSLDASPVKAYDQSGALIPNVYRVKIGSAGKSFTYYSANLVDKDQFERMCR